MAVVNKFNVNKQQVTLDADIIENMSANDVSYDTSFKYNENTVGDKLSELDIRTGGDIVKGNFNGIVFTSKQVSAGTKLYINITTDGERGIYFFDKDGTRMKVLIYAKSAGTYESIGVVPEGYTECKTQWGSVTINSLRIDGVSNKDIYTNIQNITNDIIYNDNLNFVTRSNITITNNNTLTLGTGYMYITKNKLNITHYINEEQTFSFSGSSYLTFDYNTKTISIKSHSELNDTDWILIKYDGTVGFIGGLMYETILKNTVTMLNKSKQNILTFDDIPIENSSNPVKSGGIYSAIHNITNSELLLSKKNGTYGQYGAVLFKITKVGDYIVYINSESNFQNIILVRKTDISQQSNRIRTIYPAIYTSTKVLYKVSITQEDLNDNENVYIAQYFNNFISGEYEATLYQDEPLIDNDNIIKSENDLYNIAVNNQELVLKEGITWSETSISLTIFNNYTQHLSLLNIFETSEINSFVLSEEAIANDIYFEPIVYKREGGAKRRYRQTSYTLTDIDKNEYDFITFRFSKYKDSTFLDITRADVEGQFTLNRRVKGDLTPRVEKLEEDTSDMKIDIGYSRITPINITGNTAGQEVFNNTQIKSGETLYYKFTTKNGTGGIGYFDNEGTRITFTGQDNAPIGTVSEGTIVIPDGFVTAKFIWGSTTIISLRNVAKESGLRKEIDALTDDVVSNDVVIRDYFKDEMEATISSIEKKVNAPCLVLNIITDSHFGLSGREYKRPYEHVSNIRHLNSKIYCDGVIHLGDIPSLSIGSTTNDDIIYAEMSKYLNTLALANKNFFPVNGNHDGESANHFKEARWYGIAGRITENNCIREGIAPYYYWNHKLTNTRCIFLAFPDSIDTTTYWNMTQRQLDWLRDTALDVQDGWNVIMFCHCMPLDMTNKNEVESICNNFNSTHSNSKILVWINGHHHRDHIAPAGWTFTDSKGTTITNGLSFPIVNIGANLLIKETMEWGEAPARGDNSVTQDLWDTMIYRPDLNKIFFIRFGAGDDRELTV